MLAGGGLLCSKFTLIRNRWPSGETSLVKTSSDELGSRARVWNNTVGVPNSKIAPAFTAPAMSFLSGDRKNSSLPSRRHRGCCPPSVEIWYLPPGPGNGATYTCHRPDSLEEYATQWPSGENWPCVSVDSLCAKALDFGSTPVIGSTRI